MPAHVCRNGCALRMALTMMPLMCLCPVAHGLCSVALYCRAQSLVNPDSWAGHNGPLFCAPCALQCHASSAARPGTTLVWCSHVVYSLPATGLAVFRRLRHWLRNHAQWEAGSYAS